MPKTWRNSFEWEGGGRSVLYLTDLWPWGPHERFEARKVVFSWECLNIFVTGAILKPRLVGKKLLVRSGGVSLVTSFIMSNASLKRHGNSLGIQIFLTWRTKSEANALVADKFKWKCEPRKNKIRTFLKTPVVSLALSAPLLRFSLEFRMWST